MISLILIFQNKFGELRGPDPQNEAAYKAEAKRFIEILGHTSCSDTDEIPKYVFRDFTGQILKHEGMNTKKINSTCEE